MQLLHPLVAVLLYNPLIDFGEEYTRVQMPPAKGLNLTPAVDLLMRFDINTRDGVRAEDDLICKAKTKVKDLIPVKFTPTS